MSDCMSIWNYKTVPLPARKPFSKKSVWSYVSQLKLLQWHLTLRIAQLVLIWVNALQICFTRPLVRHSCIFQWCQISYGMSFNKGWKLWYLNNSWAMAWRSQLIPRVWCAEQVQTFKDWIPRNVVLCRPRIGCLYSIEHPPPLLRCQTRVDRQRECSNHLQNLHRHM